MLRTALRLRHTQVGLLLVLLLAGVAIVGPWVAPYPPATFVAPLTAGLQPRPARHRLPRPGCA